MGARLDAVVDQFTALEYLRLRAALTAIATEQPLSLEEEQAHAKWERLGGHDAVQAEAAARVVSTAFAPDVGRPSAA